MVSPVSAGGGFTKTGICSIVDMDSLEVEVDVNESFINRVVPGQPAVANLNAYPKWDIPANVIAIIPTATKVPLDAFVVQLSDSCRKNIKIFVRRSEL